MHRTLQWLLALSLVAGVAQAQAPAQQASTTTPSAANVEDALKALRADLQSSRADIMAKNMTLSADQAAKFWPVFNAYQKEQNALIDEQLKGIQKYVDSYDTLDDANRSEPDEGPLGSGCQDERPAGEVAGRIPEGAAPKLAVRAMQIDRRLSLAAQMEIASQIPLAHSGRAAATPVTAARPSSAPCGWPSPPRFPPPRPLRRTGRPSMRRRPRRDRGRSSPHRSPYPRCPSR